MANLKVLVADDHFLIRQFVRNTLQDSKITNVQTAADGNEAIDLLQKAYDINQPYDIVFLDWNMPTISGLEVLSYFRARPEYAATAFVMLTAESEQQNIMKPVSPADLSKKLFEIHDWIKRKRDNSQAVHG
jgi:CheY-like chemotaxis protein